MTQYHFQYCPKIAVFDANNSKVLLCQRQGEADYDGVFSFIGGKMERSDNSLIDGIRREKIEEVGSDFKIRLLHPFSVNALFTKRDGNSMVLPHHYAESLGGNIQLSNEYSSYRWIDLRELDTLEPKIPNIPSITIMLLKLQNIAAEENFITM